MLFHVLAYIYLYRFLYLFIFFIFSRGATDRVRFFFYIRHHVAGGRVIMSPPTSTRSTFVVKSILTRRIYPVRSRRVRFDWPFCTPVQIIPLFNLAHHPFRYTGPYVTFVTPFVGPSSSSRTPLVKNIAWIIDVIFSGNSFDNASPTNPPLPIDDHDYSCAHLHK